MVGYTIYHNATNGKWWLVKLPDDWKRDDALPAPSSKDESFETETKAQERLSELLDTEKRD